jgi:hypothetical protein
MLSFLSTSKYAKYIALILAVAALCSASYLRGSHNKQMQWDADKAAIQAQYNAKMQANYIMAQLVAESYNKLVMAQTQKSTYTATIVGAHKKDINAGNTISDAYYAVLQNAATGQDVANVDFTNYASTRQAHYVLEYTVALINDDIECVNQLTSLQAVVKGVAK